MSTLPIFKDTEEIQTIKLDKTDLQTHDKYKGNPLKESSLKRVDEGKLLGGQPLNFTEETLTKRIEEYFEDCKERGVSPTIGRLAVFLEVSRQTLLNYKNSEKFFDIVKRAREEIGANMEEILVDPKNRNAGGPIFYMKNNMGYVDRIETVTKDGDLGQKQKMLDQFSNDVNKLDGISRNLNSRFLTE